MAASIAGVVVTSAGVAVLVAGVTVCCQVAVAVPGAQAGNAMIMAGVVVRVA